MSDYLLAHPRMVPLGGGEAATAWMLQVLLERGTVTLLTCPGHQLEALDRAYGTSLSGRRNLNVICSDPFFLRLLDQIGVTLKYLRLRLFVRELRKEGWNHGVCVCAYGILDLGNELPTVWYLHGPPENSREATYKRNVENRSNPLMKMVARLNLLLSNLLVPWQKGMSESSFAIANSFWTSRAFQELYKKPADAVLYPPPIGDKIELSKNTKRSFIAIGRAHRDKGLEDAVSIVSGLRERGHQVDLTLFVVPFEPELLGRLRELAVRYPWLHLRVEAPREEIDREISAHCFGLHASRVEAYGMAVAELLLGDCLTAVRDVGGQVEIVTESQLRFTTPEEAVEKLDAVLSSRSLEQRLRESQAARKERYTKQQFLSGFHKCLDRFEAVSPRNDESAVEKPFR